MAWFRTQSIIYGRTFLDTLIAALSTRPAGALMTTPKLRFSKDVGFNPGKLSAIADFTAGEADFSGYTAGGYAVTLSASVNLDNDRQGAVGTVIAESSTATPQVDNSLYGYWIDDGTNVIMAERFPNGQSFGLAVLGDFLVVDLTVALPNLIGGL